MEGITNSVNNIESSGGGVNMDKVSLLTWADGTETEITSMIYMQYVGIIDISDYWKVGDVRTASISEISTSNASETQPAQNIELVIIGFSHDTLETPIDEINRAAITVQTKNCLSEKGYMESVAGGYYHATWDYIVRRDWCNDNFKSALPSYLQNLIKPVVKYTNRYSLRSSDAIGQISTTDSCFLLSEYEIFGSQHIDSSYGTNDPDGSQYAYMNSHRIKYLGINGTDEVGWWSRTGYHDSDSQSHFVYCYSGECVCDVEDASLATASLGIAPAFCL